MSIRAWYRYSVVPALKGLVEKVNSSIAWMLPREVAYWCCIRVFSEYTVHKNIHPDSANVIDTLKYWKRAA